MRLNSLLFSCCNKLIQKQFRCVCHSLTSCSGHGEVGGRGEGVDVSGGLQMYRKITQLRQPWAHADPVLIGLAFCVLLSHPLSCSQLSSPLPFALCPVTSSLTFLSCLVLFNPFLSYPGLSSPILLPLWLQPHSCLNHLLHVVLNPLY